MSRETKTLALAALVGACGGCAMTGFLDAVRAGSPLVIALCAALFLVMLVSLWRVIQQYRQLKGWNPS